MSDPKEKIEEKNTVAEEEIDKERAKREEIYTQMLEDEEGGSKKGKKKALIIALVIFVLLAISAVSTVFALVNTGNEKIYKNISIDGMNVSNLTKVEAIEKLKKETREKNRIAS